eukprot:3056346-Rhodomonas_salina.3
MADTAAAPPAGENRKETLSKASAVMFEKVSKHLQGELYASTEDYTLLEKMNEVTTAKFKELTEQAATINQVPNPSGARTRCVVGAEMLYVASRTCQSCVKSQVSWCRRWTRYTSAITIDVLETSVEELVNTATLLDDYAKKLGEPHYLICFPPSLSLSLSPSLILLSYRMSGDVAILLLLISSWVE